MKQPKPHAIVRTTDAEIDAAIAKARVYDAYRPKAISATYRPADDKLVICLSSGVEVAIPRNLIQGLKTAPPSQVREVEVDDFGSALHWESLDLDHYVPSLLDGIFGTRAWMSKIGAQGGSARSEAKARAVRANGAKGGRPKKAAT